MREVRGMALLAASLLVPIHGAQAQAPAGARTGQIAPQSDEAAIRATVAAVYRAISGPVGAPRDWDEFRAAFAPDARLHAITPSGLRGGTVEDYIALSDASLVAYGFAEEELVNRIAIYGNLAQVWSSYEGRFVRDGKDESLRGINSFQLYRSSDGTWRVHALLWQQETPQFPLPAGMAGQ